MDGRKLRSISCAKWLGLFLLFTAAAQAQFVAPNMGDHFNGFDNNNGPTDTPTWDPMVPTYTPTPTATYNPFASDTPSSTPGSPTDTITNTFTATQTGTIYTPTPTWTSTPNITRASLVLLPTAYTNGRYDWTGFNWDVDFTYYIGSIISRDYTNPQQGLDSLEQINLVLLTNDLKMSLVDDNGDTPGFAMGLMTSLLAQVGSSNSGAGNTSTTGTTNNATFQVAGNAVGGLYAVMSKKVTRNTAVHFGYIYGLQNIAGDVFSTNYGSLLPYFGPGLNNSIGDNPDSLLYIGFNTYFWGRNWKMEIWKPMALWPANTYSDVPLPGNPILLNTQIDGLPLAFNLGYERWDTGYALLGYVNFRIPLLPSEPSY